MRLVSLLLAIASLAACAELGTVGSMSGNLGGHAFLVRDAVVVSDESTTTLLLADFPDLCDAIKAQRRPVGASLLTFQIQERDAQGQPIPATAGSYSTQNGDGRHWLLAAGMQVNGYDSCTPITTTAGIPTAGSVTLQSLEPTDANLTFDLTFSATEHLTGNAIATRCDAAFTKLDCG